MTRTLKQALEDWREEVEREKAEKKRREELAAEAFINWTLLEWDVLIELMVSAKERSKSHFEIYVKRTEYDWMESQRLFRHNLATGEKGFSSSPALPMWRVRREHGNYQEIEPLSYALLFLMEDEK